IDGLDTTRGLTLLSAEGWDVARLLRRLGRLPRLEPGAPWIVSGLPAGAYEIRAGAGPPQRLFVRAGDETRHALD
ncbi:MAG: hypothetical protein AAF725_26790, partial [Acidobacteriota bacterium]